MKRRLDRRLAPKLGDVLKVTIAVLGIGSIVATSGCATARKKSEALVTANEGSVVFGAFVPQGTARLSPPTPVTGIYAVGDALYVYTQNNTVYSLSQGLDIRFIKAIVSQNETLRPPVQVADELIFPTSLGLYVTTKTGDSARMLKLTNPLSSDVHVDQRGLLLAGVASDTGGRVAVIDPKREVRPVNQETLIGNVRSAPVAMHGIVFAATEKGKVFAIGDENRAAWSIDDMSFDTGRAVEADLVIDDYGLYVASTDMKLYALDRGTGKIKWRYVAEVPLMDAPVVTKDRVYQVVPGRGLAAIDKIEGKLYREPLWIADGVTRVISADDKYIYATQGNDRLVAIGIADGKVKFSAAGKFDYVTAGADGIFAGSTDGRIVKLKRGPYSGSDMETAAAR